MAQRGSELDREAFSCPICLELLKDPVTIPCGHSYCTSCIQNTWDHEAGRKIPSCPQCRQSFTPRPVLVKSTMLAALVEQLKKTKLQSDPAADRCRHNIQQRIQEREKELKLLQKEVKAISHSADKTVEDSQKIFTQLIHLMEQRRRDVEQQVRSQQEAEVSRVKELEKKLEQEIRELKRKDAELKKLSDTEDHTQFLQDYPSLSGLSGSTDSSTINIPTLSHFEDVTAAVSKLRDQLQELLSETWTSVSLAVTEVEVLPSVPGPGPEPKTRAEFLKYSCEITLDPNTAHAKLLLSEENRKVTCKSEKLAYPRHPDRFTDYYQVLSKQSLTGRCYWEVEWREGVSIAVTYKNISRAGWSNDSVFGYNDKSWALECDTSSFKFWFKRVQSPVSGPRSSRVGVYLDHSAGLLSFYSTSGIMTLLYRVQTTFTKPLHAGLWLCDSGATAEFCQLK